MIHFKLALERIMLGLFGANLADANFLSWSNDLITPSPEINH
jgi:hypothetical protein